MDVIKKKKAPSHERKGTTPTQQTAEPTTNPTVSRPPAEVVSNTEERTATTGSPHSA
jgi:hypothetical protein